MRQDTIQVGGNLPVARFFCRDPEILGGLRKPDAMLPAKTIVDPALPFGMAAE